ncbi:GNAT family N-acetyltransferase [Chitinophaga nivalis]|uniref:GNAT family N-acetyltransferase n=1 Tax=Chitinophaga nivalis TaxID=2991709 RepID=A0ABT3INF1_9BACT|nr:GNAT family N-acetyltransferase [Chitinophaga nivalis]MCW3464801.1 GNAT family N-acetyltransferase [Chitinophaga nivalis]MCW3485508.1 GNAT family N-acetyltransferase [Chitinophaga nivalis]
MHFTKATDTDIPQLVALINSAYRGEVSKQGWTSEADMIGGQRIDAASLARYIADTDTTILKYTAEDQQIKGCVYLQVKGEKMYLGLLTVSPLLQDKGIGRQLLQAAEAIAVNHNKFTMTMTVISTRYELISWYERRGYVKTGEMIPLDIPETFGILKAPLDMYILEKKL